LLVIEVAESSLAYDRWTKLRLYAEADVPAYWVVDCAAERPFPDSDRAIEWAEDQVTAATSAGDAVPDTLAIEDFDVRGMSATELATLRLMLAVRQYTTGDVVIAERAKESEHPEPEVRVPATERVLGVFGDVKRLLAAGDAFRELAQLAVQVVLASARPAGYYERVVWHESPCRCPGRGSERRRCSRLAAPGGRRGADPRTVHPRRPQVSSRLPALRLRQPGGAQGR
jgi:hypothetical protein